MTARYTWTAVAFLVLIINHFLALAGRPGQLIWILVAGYAVFGTVLLGAVSRWWRRGSPLVWRPVMLSAGAICAGAEIALRGAKGPPGWLVDQWMVALLGLLIAAIAARLLPERLPRRWFGFDRRAGDRSS